MKKVIVLFLLILSLYGCGFSNSPSDEVSMYLDKYNSLNDDVLIDVDNVISKEDLSSGNKDVYKEVLLRQYKNMKYEIKDESINDNSAMVKVSVNVYNYYNTNVNSENYKNEHTNEFYDINGMFDNNVYNTYRLGELLKTNDTISYDITFHLKKDENGKWILDNPNEETIQKLNGFYIN